jgi:site-specific DNA recombinase
MEKAVGYIRVSTKGQAEKGVSLEVQQDKIRKYCDLHDIELIEIKVDAISGQYIQKRKGAKEVFDLAEQGQIKHVVVYKLDRLFRNAEESLTYSRKLKECGVALHSLTENIDTNTPIGKFFFTITAAYAEMERGLACERTRAVFDERRERNLKLARWARLGVTVTGREDFRGKKVEQQPDENELEAISRAKIYREKGLSYREIGRQLLKDGYLSRTGNTYCPSTIKLMLSF